jgi:hypothetical protein
MKLARVFCLLVIVGASAIAAFAQTPVDPTDPHVVFNSPDQVCPVGSFCVDLTYNGPQENALIFGVPGPAGSFDPIPPAYTCESNVFADCVADTNQGDNQPATEFFAFSLFDGSVSSGETFSLTSTGGPIQLTLPSGFTCNPGSTCSTINGVLVADLTPEPATAILFVSGLILVLGIASRRFRGTQPI